MSAKKFKFVSPGIFMKEIDKSVLEVGPGAVGPIVIGRAAKGPAGTPIKVRSYAEFVSIFGEPLPGIQTGDVFRDGNKLAPTYAAYAAKAWLSSNTPLTFVRLLGEEHGSATTAGKAGWGGGTTSGVAKLLQGNSTRSGAGGDGGTAESVTSNAGGAYGLWLFDGKNQIENLGPSADGHATLPDAIDAAGVALNDAFTITVPVAAGGDGITHKIIFKQTTSQVASLSATTDWGISLDDANTDALRAAAVIDAINGTVNGAVGYGGNAVSSVYPAGELGLTAVKGSAATKVDLTMSTAGAAGNVVDVLNAVVNFAEGSKLIVTTFTGGTDDGGAANGALAAVFYCDANTSIALSGAFNFDQAGSGFAGGNEPLQFTASQAATIGTSSAGSLTMVVGTPAQIESGSNKGLAGDHPSVSKFDFNFNTDSDSFIRKVFNTNPTLTNTTITTTPNQKGYFLGETYEGWIDNKLGGWSNVTHGLLMGVKSRHSSNPKDGADFRFGRRNAYTGWYIPQDTGDATSYDNTSTQKMFRFISLNQGEWLQNNLKVSIEDVQFPNDKYNKYGTFTVSLRMLTDRDAKVQHVEVFRGVNLNPNSANYIKRRIGDKYFEWNAVEERFREYGEYPNQSKFIRVELNEQVDGGSAEGLLPFGVYGPYRLLNALNVTGATHGALNDEGDYGDGSAGMTDDHMIVGESKVAFSPWGDTATNLFTSSINVNSAYGVRLGQFEHDDSATVANNQMSSSFFWPELGLRGSSKDGDIDDARRAYWGVRTERSGSNIFDASVRDVIRALPAGIDTKRDGDAATQKSWIFSLDDIKLEVGGEAVYESGSRKAGTSYTAVYGEGLGTGNSGAKKIVNEKKWNRFTTLFHGGFDGFDIVEKDPLRNTLLGATTDAKLNYAYNTVKQALQSIKDADLLEYNIAVMPGLTEPTLTTLLIDQCEDRADSLAIVDLQNHSVAGGDGNYQPYTESSETEQDRIDYQDIDTLRKKLENREINSSYGCTYYPWVQIRDDSSAAVLKVPPSVVALGAMAFSDAVQAPWFAPAGFTRGGLSFGASGLNVVGVTHKLISEDRDKLYEMNINPIATFPAEGIVIFGQKTLQISPSALDRINVRRLLIFIKKEISRIAATTLFEQNVTATWIGFRNRVNTFLAGVKTQLGLTDFKVVLDESTTTPDLIDRNIMYAKIFLKPARSIESIALDFIITDSGASFED